MLLLVVVVICLIFLRRRVLMVCWLWTLFVVVRLYRGPVMNLVGRLRWLG